MDYILNIINSIIDCFSIRLSWEGLLGMYWFMFLVEVPRYFLMDIVVLSWRAFTTRRREGREKAARLLLYAENPLVTVLAPGKNEGRNIFKLVRSLREQTYRNFEIIIVDDGSDDDTPFICRDLEKDGYIDKYLRLFPRGGKASAANYGVHHSKGKYIVHLDADSSLDRDALERILLPFYMDGKVKGVGGTVKVRNADDSLCSSMQAIEYLNTIQVGRTVSDTLGIYHIISGAFGAFDKAAIRQVGCWDIGPGLDGDITQKLRKAGYKVRFATHAVCMTNVPVKWHVLFKQRLRWSKSLVRFRIRKHFNMLLGWKNFSFLNFLSNMENILFDCVFNYLWFFYILELSLTHTQSLMDIFIIGWMMRCVMAYISFTLCMILSERPREELKLALYLPLKTLYTGYFLRITRLIAHTQEFFFFSSYKDPWNPEKTSVYARIAGN